MFATGLIYALIAAVLWGAYMIPMKHTGPKGHHPLSFGVGIAIGFALFGWAMTLITDPSSISVTVSEYGHLLWAPMAVGFLLMLGLAFGFTAIGNIGMSRAVGIWNMSGIGTPIVSIIFFGEMRQSPGWAIAMLIIGGIIIVGGGIVIGLSGMIQAKAASQGAISETPATDDSGSSKNKNKGKAGFVQATLAAIFFSVFLVPVIAAPEFSSNYPNAWIAWGGIGAILGAIVSGYLFMGSKFTAALKVPFSFHAGAIVGGAVFTIGYMLLNKSIAILGLAVAYPIVLCDTIVSAIIGIFIYKELKGAPKAAHLCTWIGSVVVIIGVVIVSYARTVPPL